jgi:hypothetical protein
LHSSGNCCIQSPLPRIQRYLRLVIHRDAQASIHLLSSIASTPGLTSHLFARSNDPYTHPRSRLSKPKLKNCVQPGFIYPIAYTSWVSNPVPVDKKQGTIHVCTDFHHLNNACPKDNFPAPFIDQVIDDCTGHEALSFMDGFSRYNQIQIHPADQYKTAFITPWGTFAYRVMPFGLKNAGTTFQRAMTYIFHDLAEIILAYLDDLTARSKKCTQHLDDL